MKAGFYCYLAFIVSWFLHLGQRVPALGALRIDLLLILALALLMHTRPPDQRHNEVASSKTHRMLKTMLLYIVVTLPFVEWPGSVLNTGLLGFVKAAVFYYFTIYFVTTEERLKTFLTVFIICQCFRVVEPVYLHLTEGYWGSIATMSGWEYMDRLSGAPSDVVNPNGLAFVILTVLPFLFFLMNTSTANFVAAAILIPVSIYALLLTGSRSGLIGLFLILVGLILQSKRKALLLLIVAAAMTVSAQLMTANLKDRYLSIIDHNAKNAATAEGRLDGVFSDFKLALRRPLFGFGVGTSREVNANFRSNDQPSHNLYTEVAEELGFVGLGIFLSFISSIISNARRTLGAMKEEGEREYLALVAKAMAVWLYMNVIFSFASYGLSSYEWYLFAGLSTTLIGIVRDLQIRKGTVT